MRNRKQNLLMLLMMTVMVIVLVTACEKEKKLIKDITLLTYDFGSYHEGAYEFKLYYEDSTPYIQAKGYNGVKLSYKHEIAKEDLIAFEEALNQQNVAAIDGYNKRNKFILDGYGYSLEIQYSGENLSASGYMKYHKNYWEIDEVIRDFFFDNIEANTTFDRNNPMVDSTAYDEFALLGV